ncbi:MAG: hypothetical protein CVV45_14905 [Spirochaetae bacterium HGW-Spirochaetae-10]|jgi:uncharacterized integral membrane protein|nr:MAG: hypothetical protein CVV45_14905 [Spirochaetae bacterium HGW-Spirochaetae-10]
MIPMRLVLFLAGCLILAFLVLANPEEADLYLLFWYGRFPMNEIVLGSALGGAVLALLIRSHIASLTKKRQAANRRSEERVSLARKHL